MRERAADPRDYEMMIVIAPTVGDEGVGEVVDRVSGYVTAAGGEVTSTNNQNPWGRRRLAYQINDFPDAFYILYRFMAGPGAIDEVERDLRIDEQVIRHLIVRYDEMTEHEERQQGGPRRMGGTGTSQGSAQGSATTPAASAGASIPAAQSTGTAIEAGQSDVAAGGTPPPPASDDRVEPVQPDAQAAQATAQRDTDASTQDADPGASTEAGEAEGDES